MVHTGTGREILIQLGAQVVVGALDNEASLQDAAQADVIVYCALPHGFNTKRHGEGFISETARKEASWVERLMRAGKGHAKQFVYLSGGFVYGERGSEVVDETVSLTPYAVGRFKIDGEGVCRVEGPNLGYQSIVCFRPRLAYGQGGPFQSFFMDPISKKNKARFIGSGNQVWSWIHVDDLARLIVAAVENAPPGIEAVNACDELPVSVGEFIGTLAQQMGAPALGGLSPFLTGVSVGKIVEAQVGSLRLSNAKARKLFGWVPNVPTYREGVRLLAQGRGNS